MLYNIMLAQQLKSRNQQTGTPRPRTIIMNEQQHSPQQHSKSNILSASTQHFTRSQDVSHLHRAWLTQRSLRLGALSLSLLLVACGGGSSNNNDNANTTPVNNIASPNVAQQNYSATDLSAAAASSQLMTYKMLGVNGNEVQATALLFKPKGTPPVGGWPIVVWAHGTTGVADKCAPSRAPLATEQQTLFTQLLNAGYVVVAPDYEGMNGSINLPADDGQNHPFLNLKSEGFSITDAVVAARALLGSQASNQWMSVGHSQGGQAALGAAQYASRAQLNYKGTVAVAPASNLRVILATGESQAAAQSSDGAKIPIFAGLDGFTALIAAGLKNPNLNFDFATVFANPTLSLANSLAATECLPTVGGAFAQSMGQYAAGNNGSLQGYGRTVANFTNTPIVANFLDQVSQPLLVDVGTPVVIYQGKADTTVPFIATNRLELEARQRGNDIRYVVNDAWTHATALSVNINNSNILNDVKALMPTATPTNVQPALN